MFKILAALTDIPFKDLTTKSGSVLTLELVFHFIIKRNTATNILQV